jgi:hypothetical protein
MAVADGCLTARWFPTVVTLRQPEAGETLVVVAAVAMVAEAARADLMGITAELVATELAPIQPAVPL